MTVKNNIHRFSLKAFKISKNGFIKCFTNCFTISNVFLNLKNFQIFLKF